MDNTNPGASGPAPLVSPLPNAARGKWILPMSALQNN